MQTARVRCAYVSFSLFISVCEMFALIVGEVGELERNFELTHGL